jgi:hypothetical protein
MEALVLRLSCVPESWNQFKKDVNQKYSHKKYGTDMG